VDSGREVDEEVDEEADGSGEVDGDGGLCWCKAPQGTVSQCWKDTILRRNIITTTTEVYVLVLVLVLVLVNLTSRSAELGEWCGVVSTAARKEVRL
jgi:hypothetical protein